MRQRLVLLCIDDSQDVLECEKSFLESFGFAVLTAPSGREGLELACLNSVDTVYLGLLHAGDGRRRSCNRHETAKAASSNHHAFWSDRCSRANIEDG
jgi:DNA-binding response OmpR family regulator